VTGMLATADAGAPNELLELTSGVLTADEDASLPAVGANDRGIRRYTFGCEFAGAPVSNSPR